MTKGIGLRGLPQVDSLASCPELVSYPLPVRNRAARAAIEWLRSLVLDGKEADWAKAVEVAVNEARLLSLPSMRRVINLSGVVLHTGLGRARLAKEAIEAMQLAGQYSTVEIDLATGKRGDRQQHVHSLLCELTGAEDALVVNNAAAGVLLSLSALASGQDVVLSRGQMVEIGGSFRMPDIVRQSGCRLVEVGCTNKTRLSDYEEVVNSGTGAILRCHPSNFAIVGFTEEVPLADLVTLGCLVVDDQGSGLLLDTTRFGMARQPRLQDSVAAGADVVVASGDKFLGGPQAGLILGSHESIDQIRRHPLARAVRVDKTTLAALEATLRLYRDGRELDVPTWQYLSRPLDEVRILAEKLRVHEGVVIEQGLTEAGSGAAPGTGISTWRVGLSTDDPEKLLRWLREQETPIIGRIERGRVWLDPRTVEEEELELVVQTLKGWSA